MAITAKTKKSNSRRLMTFSQYLINEGISSIESGSSDSTVSSYSGEGSVVNNVKEEGVKVTTQLINDQNPPKPSYYFNENKIVAIYNGVKYEWNLQGLLDSKSVFSKKIEQELEGIAGDVFSCGTPDMLAEQISYWVDKYPELKKLEERKYSTESKYKWIALAKFRGTGIPYTMIFVYHDREGEPKSFVCGDGITTI